MRVILRHVTSAYDPATSAVIETYVDEPVFSIPTEVIEELFPRQPAEVRTGERLARITGCVTPPSINDIIFDGPNVILNNAFKITKVVDTQAQGITVAWTCTIYGPVTK